MPRYCTICVHPNRLAIDAAIVDSASFRAVAAKFRISEAALKRHKAAHLSAVLVQLHEAKEQIHEVRERASALNIAAELGTILERARLLADACDRWLRDPSNEEQYDVGPRADEVSVVYETLGDDGRPRRERRPLRHLIQRIEQELHVTVIETVTKHADIRELVLKAQAGSIQAIETVAGLLERAWALQSQMDEAAKIRAMSEAEVRAGLRSMLRETCKLSERAADAMMAAVERGARERAVEAMAEELEGESDGE